MGLVEPAVGLGGLVVGCETSDISNTGSCLWHESPFRATVAPIVPELLHSRHTFQVKGPQNPTELRPWASSRTYTGPQ